MARRRRRSRADERTPPPRAASRSRSVPGAPAGIEAGFPGIDEAPALGAVRFRCIDYAPGRVEAVELGSVDEVLERPLPDWAKVRWINVDGLHPYVVNRLRLALGFHTLAAEDVLRVHQRPTLDVREDHLLLLLRMMWLKDGQLVSEQVSVFCYDRIVLSFQEEKEGDVWDPLRRRFERRDPRLLSRGPDFLTYVLLDAVVDHFFPVLEAHSDRLEKLEEEVAERPTREHLVEIQRIRREIGMVRRALWPTRELVDQLQRADHALLGDETATFLHDVHAHAVQLMEIAESTRELCGALLELYLSLTSHRLNEVMKVLTIVSALFIPITFLAGVYGMNFEHFPELRLRHAYPAFWFTCAVVSSVQLFWFWRKGWLDTD